MQPLFNLKNKTAIVTGCAGGIGQAICHGLSLAGAKIAGTYHLSDFSETKHLVEKNGSKFCAFPVDLDEADFDAKDLLGSILCKFESLDILVNNAGLNKRDSFLNYKKEQWDSVLNVNCTQVFQLSQHFAKHIIHSGKQGKIINIQSLCSYKGGYNNLAYTVSKHALAGLTKLMANELGCNNINVNAVAPGFIETEMTRDFFKNPVSSRFKERIPLNCWGKPEDLIGAVLLLASGYSDYIHGETIVVDGGYINT